MRNHLVPVVVVVVVTSNVARLLTRICMDFSSFPAQGRSSGCSGVLLRWLCPRPCPRFQSLPFTLLRLGFQTTQYAVFWGRACLRVDGFAHFLRGGVVRAQGRTSPILSGCREISVDLWTGQWSVVSPVVALQLTTAPRPSGSCTSDCRRLLSAVAPAVGVDVASGRRRNERPCQRTDRLAVT